MADCQIKELVAELKQEFPGAMFQPFGEHNGNSKHPFEKGGYATATDDENDPRFSKPGVTGVCLFPPPDIVIIDLDVGDDKDGQAVLAEIAAKHGAKIPKTAYVKTPSGGRHLVLAVPEGVELSSSNGALGKGRGTDRPLWRPKRHRGASP